MTRKARTSVALLAGAAVIVGAICVRLGFWQLDRLAQRRAGNAVAVARLNAPPMPMDSVGGWRNSNIAFRRMTIRGTPIPEQEIVLAPRTRDGAPGVNVLTPFLLPGSSQVIYVNRGWVYSADGMTVDLAKYRESAHTFTGYLLNPSRDRGTAAIPGRVMTYRWFDAGLLSAKNHYSILPWVLVVTGDSARSTSGNLLMRLGDPPLDEGPHFGYAMQWFAFATVALVGVVIVAVRDRRAA